MERKIKLVVAVFFLSFGIPLLAQTSYLRLGEEAYAKSEYKKAFHYFEKSIEAGSRKGEPWFYMGMIYEFWRRYQESIPYFEKAISLPLEKKEYRQAALWKLVILYDRSQNYLGVIELVDKMEREGIHHNNLTKLKEKAYVLVSNPKEKLEARKLFSQARSKETHLLEGREKNNPYFWIENQKEVEEIINLYLQAFTLDTKLDDNFLWRVALYQEKLEKNVDAIESYQRIIEHHPNAPNIYMAYYKSGVLLKRIENFAMAKKSLQKVVSEKDLDKRLLYYSHINLSEVFYGLQDFQQAYVQAKLALSLNDHRIEKEKNSQLSRILFCNTFIHFSKTQQSNEEVTVPLVCDKLYLKSWQEVESTEQGLFLLSKSLYHSFLDDKANSLLLAETSLQVCQGKEQACFPSWMHYDFVLVAKLLFKNEKYNSLNKTLAIAPVVLKQNYFYNLWLAESSFYTGDYENAKLAYEKISQRSFDQEKNYWFTLVSLKEELRLYSALRNFLYRHSEQRKEIFKFLKKETAFMEFVQTENFQKLKKEFSNRIIGQ